MKKRILPIPLILLIPIVLLVIVTIAGIYRFSLTDEEILAKFPSAQVEIDAVVLSVFGIKATNPWTIQVPENNAFAFIDTLDKSQSLASGRYDSGAERGVVTVDTKMLKRVDIDGQPLFLGPMSVSNQGSGVFHYLALFKFDSSRSRMILADSELLGDRVQVQNLVLDNNSRVEVVYLQHGPNQAMSETPSEEVLLNVGFNKQQIVEQ